MKEIVVNAEIKLLKDIFSGHEQKYVNMHNGISQSLVMVPTLVFSEKNYRKLIFEAFGEGPILIKITKGEKQDVIGFRN